IRSDPEGVKAALELRGPGTSDAIDDVVALDAEQRRIVARRDEIRNGIKSLSKQVGRLRGQGQADEAEGLMADSRALGGAGGGLAKAAGVLADEVRAALLALPNVPSEDAPPGTGEQDNVVLRTEGYDAAPDGEHQRVPHWEIGAELGILDNERATKISGSMFTMYRGGGARLLRALVQLSLDGTADASEEVRPPTLGRSETMTPPGHPPNSPHKPYT